MNKLLVNLKLTVIFKYILDIYIVALVSALFVAQFYWLFQNLLIKDKD